ncbi:Testis-expressed sequence 2 protein [Orchesella cincta]|uniref:Testis-expressed sequence 2 protein n=1 Tax=Orchesella cincta TaxID=48709 RepID=A0A1D2NFK6_ORCCI|nr:Testis-expressed sequence 2 protein [Orchesella cincta]
MRSKLFFIRKPPFVESIRVKELDLGSCMPVFLTASAPLLDSQGLWVDLEMQYTGNMIITLEMYVNLLKMRSEEKLDERKRRASTSREHAMFDSDADDSGESSESDEDELAIEEKMLEKSTENRGKLILDRKIISDEEQARAEGCWEYRSYAHTAHVEIKRVAGVLAVNIPPCPATESGSGSGANPVVEISARPKFGERALGFSYLTEWIKRKILLEFQRVMVCPNMMDITVGLMEFNLPK